MADAAIAGAVFAAPNPMSIQATAEALGQAEGIIYIYGNYSGDVLNFDFAAEESENEGKRSPRFGFTMISLLRRWTGLRRAGNGRGHLCFQRRFRQRRTEAYP